MELCRRALQQGGGYPAAVNAANEVANEQFRKGAISFFRIGELIGEALSLSLPAIRNEQDILAVDEYCRQVTLEQIK